MNSNRNQVGNRGGMVLAVFTLAAIALVPSLRAQDGGQPASGAARLSSVEGQVRISQGGQVLADQAPINSPLFAGTRVETGDDGKAEIQFDDGSVARISPVSAVSLPAVGSQGGSGGTELVLEGGLAYFEMQGDGPGGIPMRVSFGDSAVTASGFTVIRIRMDNPPGELAVFSGNAHLDRGNSLAVDIHGGESLAFNSNDPSHYNLAETIESDSWDSWNSDRDQALSAETVDQTGAANSFVNSDNPSPAWNDLDANGNWYNVPGQGYIWSPYEASNADWDPYGNGNWMWTPGYGYIFVSGYPWGYMPYQCGSWNFYDGFGWGWAPGMGMGVGLRMGGCHPWWSTGRYFGPNIGRRPGGYHNIEMPHNRGPIGRTPPKVISINRGGFHGGEGGLPPRTRNSPVQIGGATVAPLRPLPGNRKYEPSQSGFVYHQRGTQSSGNGNGDVYRQNPGSGNGGSNGSRRSYEPSQGPRYTPIPSPRPPVDNSGAPGGNNGAPGGNNGNPNPGGQPGSQGGKPPMGGLVPRGYNGGYHGGTGQVDTLPNQTANPPSNPGGNEQRVRPWNGGGNGNPGGGNPGGGQNPRPPGNGGNPGASGGGSFQRPSGNTGVNSPNPGNSGGGGSFQRPSGGGNPGGGNPGGGNPGGGGGSFQRPSGGSNPGGGNSGGGGAPHSGSGASSGGNAPHGGNPK